jgi:hypothetical protein
MAHEKARSDRGFNFFDQDDEALFLALARGEFTISGLQNKALCALFPQFNSGPMSRILGRLRTHGRINEGKPLLQVLPDCARQAVVALDLKLKQLVIIPELATPPCHMI